MRERGENPEEKSSRKGHLVWNEEKSSFKQALKEGTKQ